MSTPDIVYNHGVIMEQMENYAKVQCIDLDELLIEASKHFESGETKVISVDKLQSDAILGWFETFDWGV